MAFESVNYQCPACGGPLHFASAEQKLVCDYCDSRFEVEEVEALYRERQDKADAKAGAAAVAPNPAAAADAVQELAQHAGYICSSCGAELVSDGTVAVTTCPYCGNSAVAPGQPVKFLFIFTQYIADILEGEVSGSMSVSIVKLFQIVQVYKTEGRDIFAADKVFQTSVDLADEDGARDDACEAV